MKVLLCGLLCVLFLSGQLTAAQQPEIVGAVAYTEIIQFDYTKDGTKNRVQFWLEFKGSPAVGEPGEMGYKPESGAIYYYLYDVDNKKKVDNWLMGFSMMEGPPPSGPYPMKAISIRGNEAYFTAFDMKWTIVDGGADYTMDTVTIDDGLRVRKMKMYGGDFRVVNLAIGDYALYKDCVNCHEDQARELIDKGGKHNAMSCRECHAACPREAEKGHLQPFHLPCTECHQTHSEHMTALDCNKCHKAHTADEVTYSFDLSSEYCSACHRKAAEILADSRSKHSDIACALCHQGKHKASSSCQYCHGTPHPDHVMKKIGICAACHNTAHNLDSGRPK